MREVKGKFQQGVAQPSTPIEGHEGQSVVITFLEEDNVPSQSMNEEDWEQLNQILHDCQMDTGIGSSEFLGNFI
ncbi:hypothetical protein C7B80_16780 [Cyanosarcina cf. burmensis CCALA 770]|nr:hypothetical protein C7B80_16780 [Cyanosarcina cf. burmensis CCALA 770]